jgi:hypothetical protein
LPCSLEHRTGQSGPLSEGTTSGSSSKLSDPPSSVSGTAWVAAVCSPPFWICPILAGSPTLLAVLSIGEKSQIRALDRAQPGLLLTLGRRRPVFRAGNGLAKLGFARLAPRHHFENELDCGPALGLAGCLPPIYSLRTDRCVCSWVRRGSMAWTGKAPGGRDHDSAHYRPRTHNYPVLAPSAFRRASATITCCCDFGRASLVNRMLLPDC